MASIQGKKRALENRLRTKHENIDLKEQLAEMQGKLKRLTEMIDLRATPGQKSNVSQRLMEAMLERP